MKLPLALLAALLPAPLFAADLPHNIPTKPLPGKTYHITVDSLPEPFATESASKNPKITYLPQDISLNVPPGFAVNVYAKDLNQPRWLVVSPEGDALVAESYEHRISRLIDSDKDGKADKAELFAEEKNGLNQPFGMAFSDAYFFVANTDSVIRYPYRKGGGRINGKGEKIADLPGGGYNQHWTRNIRVSPDQQWLYVTVGSESNVEVELLPRASIIRMRLDGSQKTTYASGLRNPIGLAFHPQTGEVYTGVNERDKLGDELVPDYITSVREGAFYGWPYAYLTPNHLDPRRVKDGKSEAPDKAAATVTPDVLLEAHSAVMNLQFGSETNFPERYKNGVFASLRGSWNRNQGTGYKLIYVPFKNNKPTGSYEDFLTGFLITPDEPTTWGRPVGLTALPDGSMIFADEPNNRIFRVSYKGR